MTRLVPTRLSTRLWPRVTSRLRLREARFDLLAPGTPLAAGTLPGGGTYTQAAGAGQTDETVQTSASTVARWAFVANLPRIGLLADGGIGLVLEPPRTNAQVKSIDFSDATKWAVSGATVAADAGAAPDGTITADRLTSMTSAAAAFVYNNTGNGLDSTSSVGSYWLKTGTQGTLGSQQWGSGTQRQTANPSATWTRYALASAVGATPFVAHYLNDNGAAGVSVTGDNALLWGMQVEIGKYATNHIPTTTVAASRAGFRVLIPVSRYVVGGSFRAQISHVPWADCTAYDGDSATVRLWTIDANTYAEINTTTRVLTVCVNGVSRVAAVPIWWLKGHRIEWYWRVGNGALFVRYRLSTDKGVSYTLPFDPFAGVQYTDAAISTSATSLDLWSDGGSSKWFGTGACKEDFLYTAPAWALQWLPTDDASVKAHLRGDAAYTLSAGTVSAVGSQGATGGLGWAQATGANQPSVATSGGKTYLSFDGSNDYLNGAAASSYAGASAKTVWIVAKIRNVTLNGAASYNNHMLVGDGGAGALWGAYAKVGPLAIGYNWDGTDDGVTTSVGLAAWTWLRYRHDGTTVYLSVAGGAEVTVASGATSSMAGALSVGGRASGAWAPIDVQDVIVANSATVGQQAAIDAYCAQRAA